MTLPSSCAEAALHDLCLTYGYCLDPVKAEAILSDVPEDPDEFVAAVLEAEGVEPSLVEKHVRRELREMVCDWLFDDGRGKGTKSGLPRLPATPELH